MRFWRLILAGGIFAAAMVTVPPDAACNEWTASCRLARVVANPRYSPFEDAMWPSVTFGRTLNRALALHLENGWMHQEKNVAGYREDNTDLLSIVPKLELRYDPLSNHSRSVYLEFGPALYWYRNSVALSLYPGYVPPTKATTQHVLAGFELGVGARLRPTASLALEAGLRFDTSTSWSPGRLGGNDRLLLLGAVCGAGIHF